MATFHIWFGTVSGGVDVFFVVGGFLIVLSLVSEIRRSGVVHPGRFVARQFGRLFPMAGLVLVAISVWLWLTSPLVAFQRNVSDVFAAATYWENWRLANSATDYVAAGHTKSIVQHFWAMSVQGQVVLMLMIVFAVLALAMRSRPGLLVPAAVTTLAVGGSASFLFALHGLSTSPDATYFNTFARFWEFALGGLAALLLTRPALAAPVRWILGTMGLALVLTAGLLPGDWPYPGPIALWPALGAVLVLVAGASGPLVGASRLLTWQPLVWLGNNSYGLYLWSWPVLKVYIHLFPANAEHVPLLDGIGLLAISILLSWLSSLLFRVLTIRVPVRRPVSPPLTSAADSGMGPLRSGPAADQETAPTTSDDDTAPASPGDGTFEPAATPGSAAEDRPHPRTRRSRLIPAALVPLVAVASLVGVIQAPSVQARAMSELALRAEPFSDLAQLQAAVQQTLLSPQIPEGPLQIGVESLGPELQLGGCVLVTDDNLEDCRFGEGDKRIWVIGDSQAASLGQALITASGPDTTVQLGGMATCAFSQGKPLIDILGQEGVLISPEQCLAHNEWALERILQDPPDLVVMTQGAWWFGNGLPTWDEGLGRLMAQGSLEYIRALQNAGIDVAWVDSVPPITTLEECVSALTLEEVEANCSLELTQDHHDRADQIADVLGANGVHVVPTLSWFCDTETDRCPFIVAGTPVWGDLQHMTLQYATALQNIYRQQLLVPLGL